LHICRHGFVACLRVSVTAQEADRDEYARRLAALLKAGQMEQGEEKVRVLNETREKFERFAQEYPNSIYADDSLFIYCLIEFMGAVMVPPRDMDTGRQLIVNMEKW